jgi:hypothetical protein
MQDQEISHPEASRRLVELGLEKEMRSLLAEGVGFEPTVPLQARRFSSSGKLVFTHPFKCCCFLKSQPNQAGKCQPVCLRFEQ